MELKARSEQVEEVWRGGSAAASSSPELRRRAVVLWGFWAGNGRKSKGKRMRGSSRCWGARELGCWGSAPGWPRRRRSGGRADGRGGVVKEGEIQREGRRAAWSLGATRGYHREQEVACGPPRRRWLRFAPTAGEAERERGGRRLLDLFAISEKSNGPTIKQK